MLSSFYFQSSLKWTEPHTYSCPLILTDGVLSCVCLSERCRCFWFENNVEFGVSGTTWERKRGTTLQTGSQTSNFLSLNPSLPLPRPLQSHWLTTIEHCDNWKRWKNNVKVSCVCTPAKTLRLLNTRRGQRLVTRDKLSCFPLEQRLNGCKISYERPWGLRERAQWQPAPLTQPDIDVIRMLFYSASSHSCQLHVMSKWCLPNANAIQADVTPASHAPRAHHWLRG